MEHIRTGRVHCSLRGSCGGPFSISLHLVTLLSAIPSSSAVPLNVLRHVRAETRTSVLILFQRRRYRRVVEGGT